MQLIYTLHGFEMLDNIKNIMINIKTKFWLLVIG